MQRRRCGLVINYITGVAGYIWFVRNVKHFFAQPITCTSGRSELFCKLNIRLKTQVLRTQKRTTPDFLGTELRNTSADD